MHQATNEFLHEIQKLAGLKSLEEAGSIARIVISLIKARIGPELSEIIADSASRDLAMLWRSTTLPSKAMGRQDLLFKLEEIADTTLRATRSIRLDTACTASENKNASTIRHK